MTATKQFLINQENGVALFDEGDGIGILSIQSKACAATALVLTGILAALQLAESQLQGMIIWQPNPKYFCVGADLPYVCKLAEHQDEASIRAYLSRFQETALALRYSAVPVIAAIQGYALGGGCELAMHSTKVVAYHESKVGLVEAAIGLIPAGGGSKEMVLRAAKTPDYEHNLVAHYLQVAEGVMAKSAKEAQQLHYLRDTDVIVEKSNDLLSMAKTILKNLAYEKPLPPEIPTLSGVTSKTLMEKFMMKHPEASEYDCFVAEQIAKVFAGNDHHGVLSEKAWLALELDAFVTLAMQRLTQERIQYTLKTGKHLHN